MDLDFINQKEGRLFRINMVLASVFWGLLVLFTLGMGLVYVLGFFVFYLFAQSSLIAHLKGNAVLISDQQYPLLYARIKAACEKLNMKAPEVYLMNGNGIMNAFATRFLNRHYIVLLSDVVDSFEDEDSAIDFYIGHELGHIHRRHLRWWPFFAPLNLLPLLMPAYQRACEFTCDQYGKFCCGNTEDAVRGLSLLASGGKRLRTFSAANYVGQIAESGGFWMSFHELTSSYPWLSKRVAMVQAGERATRRFPERHPLARLLAFFCPGFLSGSFFPILMLYLGLFMGVGLVAGLKNKEKIPVQASTVSTQSVKNEQNA